MRTLCYAFFFFLAISTTSMAQAPVITNISGPAAVCSNPGPSVNYFAQASNSPTSYTWTVSPTALVIPSNGPNTTVFFPNTNFIYTISCTASNSSGVSNVFTYTVQVYEMPTVLFSGGYTQCQGSSTNLSATSTIIHSASSALSYSWSPSTGLNTSTGPNVVATPSTTTTYTMQVTLGFCINTYQTTVLVMPTPVLNANTDRSTICKGESATITLSSNATANYFNFLPMMNNLMVVNPTTTTSYTLSGRIGNCQSFAVVTQNVDACVGIQNTRGDIFETLSVYPNPSSGNFMIRSPRTEKINISNELGQVIRQVDLTENEETEIRELPAGIYFMIGRISTTKVVVTR